MEDCKTLMRDEIKGELLLCLTKHKGIIPYILYHGTKQKEDASFTPRPIYPWAKHPGIH
jgi:hypothetical protein